MARTVHEIDEQEDTQPLEDWEILTEIVIAMVNKPGSVKVEQELVSDIIRYTIHVAPEDIGKVIGRNGDTVSILRKLIGRIAAGRGQKIAIDVFDPRKSTSPRDSSRAA